ncbi:MAG: hypothetical protein HOO96_42905, partial [Polyangiaceae bacterium]|nr:hypothetical protein [Polyangiaceae bacterium]
MRNTRVLALAMGPILTISALLACGGSPKLPAGPGPEYEEPAVTASAPTVSPSGPTATGPTASADGTG